MNPEYRLDARGMWEQQLCTKGGKTKGLLVVLRARESRNWQQIITMKRRHPSWEWRAQWAHLRKTVETEGGFSDLHLR